jgi:hypothetical protein
MFFILTRPFSIDSPSRRAFNNLHHLSSQDISDYVSAILAKDGSRISFQTWFYYETLLMMLSGRKAYTDRACWEQGSGDNILI